MFRGLSPLEGGGFEPSVPRVDTLWFRAPRRSPGVSWLWKSPSRPTDSTGRDRAEVTAAQASQREIFGILQRPPEMGSGFGVAPLAWRRPIDLLRTSRVPDSRAAVLAQAKAELARRERERPRARQLYSSRARTRSSNPSPSSGESGEICSS